MSEFQHLSRDTRTGKHVSRRVKKSGTTVCLDMTSTAPVLRTVLFAVFVIGSYRITEPGTTCRYYLTPPQVYVTQYFAGQTCRHKINNEDEASFRTT